MVLTEKQKALGWREGTVAEFLGLTPADVAYIDMKTALSGALKETRGRLGLTQCEGAARLGVTQPYFARLEAGGARTVTLDALINALLELGWGQREVGLLMAGEAPPAPKRQTKPQAPQVAPKRRRLSRAKAIA